MASNDNTAAAATATTSADVKNDIQSRLSSADLLYGYNRDEIDAAKLASRKE
jgi:hypothetical protein